MGMRREGMRRGRKGWGAVVLGVCLRVLTAVIAVALLAAGLAGCGRRGGLEPALDPNVPAATGKADGALVMRRPKAVPITPPHDAFILDPLL